MAQSEVVQRVAQIVDRLTPLAAMTRGAPLRSEDWNALVVSIIGLAQVALAREQAAPEALETHFAARDHAHVGQVDTSWLDAATRDLLERGGAGSPEEREQARTVADRIADVRRDVTAAQDQLRRLQLALDGLTDSGEVRGNALKRLESRVEGLLNVQANVDRLEGRFRDLGTRADDVLRFRNELVDAAGNRIDVAGVAGRVQNLEALRDNLKAADGTVVRYRDFESRVLTLEGRMISRQDLDQVIVERLRSGGAVETLSAAVQERLQGTLTSRFTEVSTRIDGLTTSLAEAQGRTASQSEIVAALTTRVSATEAQQGRIGALATQVEGAVGRLSAVETTVQAHTSALGPLRDLPDQVGAVRARVAAVEPLAGSVRALETSVSEVRGSLGRLDAVENRVTALQGLTATVSSTVARVGNLEASLSATRSDVGSLASRFTVVESTTDDATRRLRTLEGDVGTVKTRVDTISRTTVVSPSTTVVERPSTTVVERPSISVGRLAGPGVGP